MMCIEWKLHPFFLLRADTLIENIKVLQQEFIQKIIMLHQAIITLPAS